MTDALNFKTNALTADQIRPLRILIAIPTEAHGGCEYNAITFGADLAKNFICDVWVSFPLTDTLEYMARIVTENGMNYVPLDCDFRNSDKAADMPMQHQGMWSVLDIVQPDAVFIPLPWPKRGQGLISACSAIGIPALVKFALVPEDWGEKDFVNPATKAALNQGQIWFANSAYSAELLEKHYKLPARTVDHFHVGPIGLNRLREPGSTNISDEAQAPRPPKSRAELLGLADLNETDFVITSIARLSEQKGYSYLLNAAIQLIGRHPQLRFVWVGEGGLRAELEDEIAAKGLQKHFSLLGFRKDVREILRESNLFVLPTVYEGGCSQALLEAMEEQVPVIVSNTSAVGEVIKHGQNGLLAECRSAEDLERQIEHAISDAGLCANMVDQATETVREFSAEIMFANTRIRLEKLLHRSFVSQDAPSDQEGGTLPTVSLTINDSELLVDLARSNYLPGMQLVRGSDLSHNRLLMHKSGAFHIADAIMGKVTNIFITGEASVTPEALSQLGLTLSGRALQVAISISGSRFKLKAIIPSDLLNNPESGLTFEMNLPEKDQVADKRKSAGTLQIRKIAFRLKPSG